MFVKICGLTTLKDTLSAIDAGAQAVGFNFIHSSPRFIEEQTLSRWIRSIPAHVWKVGVFANESADRVKAVSQRLGLDVAQLHGDEAPSDVPRGVRVWKAARVRPGFDPAPLDRFDTEALLLDGPASGVPFDWSVARTNGHKLILAGGLHSGNVREAIAQLKPWGVDACSRIESSPGRKDYAAMAEFIQTVLSC